MTSNTRPAGDAALPADLDAAPELDGPSPLSRSTGSFSSLNSVVDVLPPPVQFRYSQGEAAAGNGDRAVSSLPVTGTAGRFQLLGEIARGGKGAVLKGRDNSLGRDLAIKVLLDIHEGNPDVRSRFIEEAQLGSQLQHLGIAPAYEPGHLPDLRPFFVMKLVKGETLDALLTGRADPSQDRPRFLAIFEQVCHALAYAHSRGIVHRDLKPAHVMVGAFNEVQVMGWGLAKVLGERPETPLPQTLVRPVRNRMPDSEPPAVTLLGTPAYLPPEQARGDLDRVDARSDVFGLGAILCVILTGQPPYVGSRPEALHKARNADLADALTRLDRSGAADVLLQLAKECLAAEPADRPHDAGPVAERLTSYLATVPERDRALQARRARRRTAGLAASVFATVLLAGGGWVWIDRRDRARESKVELAMQAATLQRNQAAASADGLAKRSEASALEAETDRALLERLADIRSSQADDPDGVGTDTGYGDAFRWYGIDVDALTPGEAGARIANRPHAVAVEIAAALDDWASVRRQRMREQAGWRHLVAVSRSADRDPWRDTLRNTLVREDLSDTGRVEVLQKLATAPDLGQLPVESLTLLAGALADAGDLDGSLILLRRARQWHPDDGWINFNLAAYLQRGNPLQREESLRYFTVARALRPGTAHDLALALADQGEIDEAITVLQDLVRLRPEHGPHHASLGFLLQAQGRAGEADAAFDVAIAAYRNALRLKPDLASAHHRLSITLGMKGDHDAAIAASREAIRLQPDLAEAHSVLGLELLGKGAYDDAIAAFREAIRLKSDLALAHNGLGFALQRKGANAEAIVAYREAVRLKPDHVEALNGLGLALWSEGTFDEAIVAYREAIRLKPDYVEALNGLGLALWSEGTFDEAIAAYREVIHLKPDHAEAHNGLGMALIGKGANEEAIAAFRAAIGLKPDRAEAHSNLANALLSKGAYDEAIAAIREAIRLKPNAAEGHLLLGLALANKDAHAEAIAAYREAIRLKPDLAEAHYSLGFALRGTGAYDEAIAAFREAIRLKLPDLAAASNGLGLALMDKGAYDEAIAACREAIRLKPALAEAHNGLGLALAGKGSMDEAIASYREAIRLEPDFFFTHLNLGNALRGKGANDEAIAAYREAIRLKPDFAAAHNGLGFALAGAGSFDEAIAAYHEGLRLKPGDAFAHCALGIALRQRGQFAEALSALRTGNELGAKVPGWPPVYAQLLRDCQRQVELESQIPAVLRSEVRLADADEQVAFAAICSFKGLSGASARFYQEAFQAKPVVAEDLEGGYRYNAACAAALAGCGRGKDEPPPDEEARIRWRKQALDWLKADLASQAKRLEAGSPQDLREVRQTLQHWQVDPDLAVLRDEDDLAKLPEPEREESRKLWAEVDALIKRAQ